jgi:hypothetical protein
VVPAMRFPFRTILLLLVMCLPACEARDSPLLRKVQLIHPDGTTAALADRDLSPFQRLLRSRIPPPEHKPRMEQIFAVEVDTPDGQGFEGEYLALARSGKTAELQYFEQVDHQPRLDRFFYRTLTEGEWNEFSAFLVSHPLQVYLSAPAPSTPTTQPAGTAQTQAASEAVQNQPPDFQMILTDAQANATITMLVQGEVLDQASAKELVHRLHTLRDAGGLTCCYYQPVPPNSQLLFADPFRAILGVWAKGDDIRAVVSPPWHPLDAAPATMPEPHWIAFKEQQWVGSEPPPEPPATATAPAAIPTTVPATEPVNSGAAVMPADIAASGKGLDVSATEAATPATKPSPFSPTDLLPKEEYWTAEPRGNFTAVTHYIPLNEYHAQRVEFWVPTFQFDDEHMCVDAGRGILYLIHDGQLFALPIPPAALSAH